MNICATPRIVWFYCESPSGSRAEDQDQTRTRPGLAEAEKRQGKVEYRIFHRNKDRMSLKMEMDVSGVSRAHVGPSAEGKATLKPEGERPRCASTPCSPIRGTVAGYQILHMDSNYLVGFTTGEELLQLAHTWSDSTPDKGSVLEALPSPLPSTVPKSLNLGIHHSSRIFKAKNRYYQPYDIPAASGRRRRRMPSSSETLLRSGDTVRTLHSPLPLCLLKGKRAQSKSLDYLNLDKMTIQESTDTEVLQYQLQHLTLRGERVFSRNKT